MASLDDPQNLMPDAARQAKIKAAIDEYNLERPGILKSCYTVAGLCMAGYVAVAGLLVIGAFNLDEKHKLLGIVGGLLIFGGIKLWEFLMRPIKDHQLTLRYRLFPEIFGFIDGVSYSHGHAPGFIDEINAMKMVRFSSTENDDVITGTHDELYFELVEAKLVLGSGKHKETVFQGLIFHFRLDTPFPGLLFAAKRGNWLQEWVRETFGSSGDMIASGNWEVDETHEFHTDNYSVARPLVEGPLASALVYLKREWSDGEARIALRNDECYLLLPSKQDYFALPDIHTDVAYADVTPMIREMAVLLAVAHLMKKVSLAEEERAEMAPPSR
ncbi:DUF3137 domain-containing protein [Rhizobium sp. KVB221]|uniref:DUF3137 domain-containing protein n=1 Tax=Rhizobium setariae TaxID=2801340 RepID=A0A936YU16_9HYPH|nr:DUF3137 domain-containing protein [Rhizobium setariae]MBL0373111.1 DUF3137 domain-containing protein [Rhizobium setariae]